MAFVESARNAVAHGDATDPLVIALRFLLQHGVGHINARPWGLIAAELERHGIEMSQKQFQQTLLSETRAGDIFIGSTDHGAAKGYFLIASLEDANVAREFYVRRIAAQTQNLQRLDELIQQNPF